MFAFAIYDRRLDALYLARDRIGVSPCISMMMEFSLYLDLKLRQF